MTDAEYRSPFDDREREAVYGSHEWFGWYTYREAFASDGSAYNLNRMLSYVTMDNPPDAPTLRQRKARHSVLADVWPMVLALLSMLFLAVGIVVAHV